MTMRGNPTWQFFGGLVMLVLGLIIGCEAIQDGPSENDETVARPLGPRGAVARQSPARSRQKLWAGLVFGCLGAGLGFYGLRGLRRQGKLLRDGVPVLGRIVRIRHEHDRARDTEVTYRFQDADGVMHEGVYQSPIAGGLEGYTEGQEVTVIYEAANSRNHMLDVDNVRRAEAAVRRI